MLSAVIKLMILISLSLSGSGEMARYDNYRVYDVAIENEDQLDLIKKIEENYNVVREKFNFLEKFN